METMEDMLGQLKRRIEVGLHHRNANIIDGACETFRVQAHEHLAERNGCNHVHDDTPIALLLGKATRIINALEAIGVLTAGDFRGLEYGKLYGKLANTFGVGDRITQAAIAKLRDCGVELADFHDTAQK